MEGWVKRRASHRTWVYHNRYLVLNVSAQMLLYYNRQKSLTPRRSLALHANCKVSDPFQRDSGSEALWCFRVTFQKGALDEDSSAIVDVEDKSNAKLPNLELAVPDYDTCLAWCTAIRDCIQTMRTERNRGSHGANRVTSDFNDMQGSDVVREADYGDVPVAFRHIIDKRSIESPLDSSDVVVDRIDSGITIYREKNLETDTGPEWNIVRAFNLNIYGSTAAFAITLALLLTAAWSPFVKLVVMVFGFGLSCALVMRNVQRMKGLKPVFLAGQHIRGSPREVNQVLLATDHTRLLWDGCNTTTTVLETKDEHVDYVHIQQRCVFAWPFWYKPRDMVCQRYWAREADGSYVIIMQSTTHKAAPPSSQFIRAEVLFWSYLICPLKPEYLLEDSRMVMTSYVVETIRLDPRGVVAHMHPFHHFSYPFVAPLLTNLTSLASYMRSKDFVDAVTRSRRAAIPLHHLTKRTVRRAHSKHLPTSRATEKVTDQDGETTDITSLLDEDTTLSKEQESGLDSDAAGHDSDSLSVSSSSEELYVVEDGIVKNIPRLPCTTAPERFREPDATKYSIRGPTYLEDRIKVRAEPAIFRLVAADIYSFEDPDECRHIAARSRICAEANAATGDDKESRFTFVAVIIPPSSKNLAVVMHYQPLYPTWREDHPRFNDLFQKFLDGDDDYRNQRFKLIPDLVHGPLMLRAALRTRPAIPGTKRVDIGYYQGTNYLEIDIDVSGQNKAKYLTSLAMPIAKSLITDLAFLIESQHVAELPEQIMGVVRFDHVDTNKFVRISKGTQELPPAEALGVSSSL
eukprot:m.186529 g.186529  ORF g.186529 m.186529 type:complete len:800 (-) comp16920_c0_seq3:1324-3723(-)